MAELHVEPKRRSRLMWLWIVIALLIIIGLIWYFASNRGAGLPGSSEISLPRARDLALTWARTLAA